MKKKGIKRFLESLNLAENENSIQLPELRSINLRSNGNHSIDFRRDRITFDSENELIKIKEYTYKPVNGLFLNGKIKGNILKFKNAIQNTIFRFRKPMVGDTIFVLKKSDKSILSSDAKIASITSEYYVLDKFVDIEDDDYIIGYADPNLFTNASQDLLTPGLFFHYTPKTKFTTDIYIDYFAITSLSTTSEYFGL